MTVIKMVGFIVLVSAFVSVIFVDIALCFFSIDGIKNALKIKHDIKKRRLFLIMSVLTILLAVILLILDISVVFRA